MTINITPQRPSETALMTALRRALAHRAYGEASLGSDDLAEVFLPPYFRFFLKFKAIRKNSQQRLDGYFPGLSAYIMARTAHFDRLFKEALEARIPQIVFLGAGYDSRAYRFAQLNRGAQIYELDSAPTQDRKIECLRKARLETSPQIHFVPIDFNTQALDTVLEHAGFRPGEQTVFLWEGVSYYLEPEAVDSTLANFQQAAHPQSTLAFDYTVTLTDGNMELFYGAKEFTQAMKQAHPGEALLFSLAEGEIETFLARRGLRLVEHLDHDEIERRYLYAEDGALIGRITGHFLFVLAAPEPPGGR